MECDPLATEGILFRQVQKSRSRLARLEEGQGVSNLALRLDDADVERARDLKCATQQVKRQRCLFLPARACQPPLGGLFQMVPSWL